MAVELSIQKRYFLIRISFCVNLKASRVSASMRRLSKHALSLFRVRERATSRQSQKARSPGETMKSSAFHGIGIFLQLSAALFSNNTRAFLNSLYGSSQLLLYIVTSRVGEQRRTIGLAWCLAVLDVGGSRVRIIDRNKFFLEADLHVRERRCALFLHTFSSLTGMSMSILHTRASQWISSATAACHRYVGQIAEPE